MVPLEEVPLSASGIKPSTLSEVQQLLLTHGSLNPLTFYSPPMPPIAPPLPVTLDKTGPYF